MKTGFLSTCLFFFLIVFATGNVFSQNVGIGTPAPVARLHITDSNVLFSAVGDIPVTSGNTPVSGGGRRMMWYPDKAAFRAGYVSGTQWDAGSIGEYSVAMGANATASGYSSIAIGNLTTATGLHSTAMGYNTTASNFSSTAMGYFTNALGSSSTAMGYLTTASGGSSTAIGFYAVASASNSTAIGSFVSTNGQSGTTVIGDYSSTTYFNAYSTNSFWCRFSGGYNFYSNSIGTTGVLLTAGGNSWSAVSDARVKENFEPVNGEDVLHKISTIPLTTWNYKGQDVKTYRHYGPMAQDFYNAFGKDSYGTIGCDTLINQQDFIGVNFIAVKALEERTQQQQKIIESQQQQLNELKKQIQLIIQKK